MESSSFVERLKGEFRRKFHVIDQAFPVNTEDVEKKKNDRRREHNGTYI